MKKIKIPLLALLLALSGPTWAQPRPTATAAVVPVPISEEKAVLAALAPRIKADLGLAAPVKAEWMNKVGDWLYFHGRLQPAPGQSRFDYSKTNRAALQEHISDAVMALLQKDKQGVWQVRELVIGPGDMASEAWPPKYELPKQLVQIPAEAEPKSE